MLISAAVNILNVNSRLGNVNAVNPDLVCISVLLFVKMLKMRKS